MSVSAHLTSTGLCWHSLLCESLNTMVSWGENLVSAGSSRGWGTGTGQERLLAPWMWALNYSGVWGSHALLPLVTPSHMECFPNTFGKHWVSVGMAVSVTAIQTLRQTIRKKRHLSAPRSHRIYYQEARFSQLENGLWTCVLCGPGQPLASGNVRYSMPGRRPTHAGLGRERGS